MGENSRQSRHYALIAAAQSKDLEGAQKATEVLLAENMGLVRTAAQRFRERGVEYEDLLQIGTMGMLRAIRSFDLSRGLAFSTYAVPLIVGEIRRYLRDDGLIRVSRNYKKLCRELCDKRTEILVREGREAGVEELAALCGVSREEAAVAMTSATPVASLSDPVFEEDKGELSDRLVDEEGLHESEMLNNKIALREAIARMPALWQKILLLRYFRDRTQQQTADSLGLTQVKISREEKKILEFLRGELIV